MNALLCPSGDCGAYPAFAQRPKAAGKVTAAECLPVDSVSAAVCVDALLSGRRERVQRIALRHGQVAPEGCAGEGDGAWLQQLRLAANIHYQNVSVELARGRRVRLRVVADVQPGEELQLWFAPQVLLAMQIPFLSPANIKGQNVYCCHECARVFEDPNPLKIHLARHCDALPLDVLWQRLRSALPQPPSPPRSAFHAPRTPTPPSSASGKYADAEHLANSHLETLVSNMGTSKQGHLCIYCGKLYSRKYGLKIHIRTHTGFKPLQCKFCRRPFGDPSNLNKHLRLHLQSQAPAAHPALHKCHLCAKVMLRKRDLQRHVELRHLHAQPPADEEQRSRDSVSGVSSHSGGSSASEEEEDEDMELEVDVESD